MNITDCWELYKQEHLPLTATPEKTIARWEKLQWFADRDAELITPADIKAYVEHRGVSPSTSNRDLNVLNAIIRYAWKQGKIQRVPFIQRMPNPPPKLRYLSVEEVRRVMEAAKQDTWQTDVFVRIALSTGARTGAILDLTWDKIDSESMSVDLRASDAEAYRRKGRAVVPINGLLREALDKARLTRHGPYVIHMDGRRCSSVQRMMKRIGYKAGVPDFTAHVLRHTVATLLLQGGEDLLKVSRLIGHKNSKTTEQIYFAHTTKWLRGTSDKLNFTQENKDAPSELEVRVHREGPSGSRRGKARPKKRAP